MMKRVIVLSIVMMLTWSGCLWDPPDNDQDIPTNSVPVADAGDNSRTVFFDDADRVILDGSDSFDPDGDELTYTWIALDADISIDELLVHEVSLILDLSSETGEDFSFMLFVSDGQVTSAPDIVTIHVESPQARVDNDYYDDPENGKFTSVQSAVEAVGPGDLIAIYPGTYSEHVEVAEGIRLLGVAGASGELPEITSSVESEGDNRSVLHLNSGVIIENLIISCSASPEVDHNCSIVNIRENSNDIAIKNCRIQLQEGIPILAVDGVSIERGAGVSIAEGTRIENISGEGIYGHLDSILNVNHSRIGNTWGSAIYILAGESNTSITDTVIYHTGYHGIHSESPSVTIDHCTVAYFLKDGIYIHNDSEPSITNTLVFTTQDYIDEYISDGDDDVFHYYGGTIDTSLIDSSSGCLPNQDSGSTSTVMFSNSDFESGILELSDQSPAIGAATDGTDVGAHGDILYP